MCAVFRPFGQRTRVNPKPEAGQADVTPSRPSWRERGKQVRHRRVISQSGRRKGIAAVYLAVSLTVILGMASLAVDVGALYSAKAELQRSADAAALAAASELGTSTADDPTADAFDTADQVARLNQVLQATVGVDSTNDLEFGRATYNDVNGRFEFSPGGEVYDAVRVTLRRTSGSASGPIDLMFAKFLGHETASMTARAAAVLVPRDIAVVIDLSGSMDYDSQLRSWNRTDGGYANTRDVWCALDGPEPSRPYVPGSETDSEYAGDSGPGFGLMTTWGNALDPGSYSASSDPGLFYIKKKLNCTDATISSSLTARGYSADERSILLGGAGDNNSTHHKNRVCVLLGLCEWMSGRAGGKYSSGGNGDTLIADGETTAWVSYPSWRVGGWSWRDYANWVSNNTIYNTYQTAFRYRYGPKTLTDYLLANYPEYSKNNNLWATPEQPVRAVKDAVLTMMDVIAALESPDHVSLEVFATTGRHEVNLTDSLYSISDRLYERQAGHYDRTTNIAGGLIKGISELQSSRARDAATKIIVLMSDGVANTDEDGNWLGDYSAAARQYAIDRAHEAADEGFVIYTVSVGYEVDRELLQEIAAIGHGQEFYAVGSPEEYTEQLESIFRTLGGKRPVALIE